MPTVYSNPTEVEICINSASRDAVRRAVSAAYEGGASRVELCAAMDVGGLTPPPDHIAEARKAFHDRPGLIVMIRPHAKSFVYTREEIETMAAQIQAAHEAGADGIAVGALRHDGQVDVEAMQRLLDAARSFGLAVTFHRAFDAAPDPLAALDVLMELEIDRVLTAGIPWGSPGSALQGALLLREVVRRAGQTLEIVVGGGVNPENVGRILRQLPLSEGKVSVHAYSGAQHQGETTPDAVRTFVLAANAASESPPLKAHKGRFCE